MRVLQLIDSLDAGGAERVAVTYANALSDKIEKSFLCATRKEGLLKGTIDEKVNYLFLNKTHKLDVSAIFNLLKYVKKHKINVIHAHSSSFFTATLVKLLWPKMTLIWHDHYGNSEMLDKRNFQILKWCSRKFSAIICVNTDLETWAKRHLKTKKVYFLRNGVSFSSKSENKTIELKGVERKRLVCLANFRPQKDHKNLLEAFSLVVQKHPGYSLHLFGQNWNDDYFEEINQLMNGAILKEAVYYYGSHANVYEILKQCNIGVLSSQSEGLPLSLLEFGLVGLGVVCTNVGQCAEVINGYGKIVESKQPEQLANAINYYIEHSKEMVQDARSFQVHVEENYSLKVIITQLVSYYESSS